MTAPNLPGAGVPDGATQGSGLAGHQDITEATVRSHYEDPIRSRLEGARGEADNRFLGTIAEIAERIFNPWFGGGAVGEPQEIDYTIEAIKQAVLNGYVVDTFAYSGTYAVPDCSELTVWMIGAGESGKNGRPYSERAYSVGGRGGGFISVPLDPVSLAGKTLTVTIGSSAGAATVIHDGTTELARCASGVEGGIAAGLAFAPTTSRPGDGGRGGYGAKGTSNTASDWQAAGEAGSSSALGAGGIGGGINNENGMPGGNGATVSPATIVKSGGGGGGGGAGGAATFFAGYNGSPGGNGGYPGGGGGGGGGNGKGGSLNDGALGAGGIGAPGVAWFSWR